MAGNAVTAREATIEIVALRIFRKADSDGVLITRRYVDGELKRLRRHGLECRCNEPCDLVRKTNAASVFRCATAWQRQISATRLLARR